MKASEIFKQYIWLTDTIYRSGGISLQELNERWVRTEMSGGLPMTRMTFNRHKMAIEEIFGLCIECQRKGGYYYYIENEEVLKNNNLQHWMLDSLSISNLLMESGSLKDRIVLENIPAGKEYLQPIINAMKQDHRLMMTYRKFGQTTGYTITVEPYAIKVFKQRWYLLAKDNKRESPTIYALDRILALEETEESFVYPSDFDTETFFKDCYGVICGTEDNPQRIVVRAYLPLTNYLRTLPLHHSQKVLKSTPDYTDFEFYLCPTFDFRQELLSQGEEVEVLEPMGFREEMKGIAKKMMERYE
ncbi:MAG: WYL domain-containing protein [Bacteroidaceae bacterium]|nr:WYL domain-containing protein [Bacteroidaceae bacterium]